MKFTNKKGFTIVELVIVIAVIAILAAVLVPTFSSLIDKANASSALQSARNAWMEYIALDDEDLSSAERIGLNYKITSDKTDANGTAYVFYVVDGEFSDEAPTGSVVLHELTVSGNEATHSTTCGVKDCPVTPAA